MSGQNEQSGVPASPSGSQASPAAPSGSAPSVSIPNAGQYVVFDSGWSWGASYQAREIEKVTPKLLKLRRGGYPGRIERAKALAYFADREKALLICQSLAGVDGEFQRRRRAAEGDCQQRIVAARQAQEKSIRTLLAASGIEAATADETRSGSAEGESPAGAAGDAQTQEPKS